MIQILDSHTIDKIAAGEVVEKPASVVKELVENAIDSGANMITVDIKEGGIDFIRVTDNGCGIPSKEVTTAFLRHATSKICCDEDLNYLHTLGFRGEALASISAVSKVEMITKTASEDTGTRIYVEAGIVKETETVGAPNGTTVIVRNLFYNTPARKKFLKSSATEAAHIVELMQHIALCEPGLSFKVVVGGKLKFNTTGKGDLKEVIYRIFGREAANNSIPICVNKDDISIEGYIGKPELVRSNRNFENYFINRRFVRSNVIADGIEEGYRAYLMQHKFPFCVLHIDIDTQALDVNVHPTKMEVRISNPAVLSELLIESIRDTLNGKELIPEIVLTPEVKETVKPGTVPEPFEKSRIEIKSETPAEADNSKISESVKNVSMLFFDEEEKDCEETADEIHNEIFNTVNKNSTISIADSYKPATHSEFKHDIIEKEAVQPDLFEQKLFQNENRSKIKILDQIFDTYWLFTFEDKIYCLDQHAAHEKVKYEEFMERLKNDKVISQPLIVPEIINLKPSEFAVFTEYNETFARMGFEAEEFGQDAIAIRSIPMELYGASVSELFLEILEEVSKTSGQGSIGVITDRIATRACKAAVKGNNSLSREEAEELIDKLMTLNNPYNCPHGRPTMIALSKYELEKKFKRIV